MFWKNKPQLRPAVPDDLKWIKASYKFENKQIPSDEWMLSRFAQYNEGIVGEDYHPMFESGFGPVGIVLAIANGHIYEPHVEWFSWATPKNKLRLGVAYFQKFRYRNLGVIRVHALQQSVKFFKRLNDYVPLNYVGKIPAGDKWGRGDDFIFYMKCRGSQ